MGIREKAHRVLAGTTRGPSGDDYSCGLIYWQGRLQLRANILRNGILLLMHLCRDLITSKGASRCKFQLHFAAPPSTHPLAHRVPYPKPAPPTLT